MPYTPAAARPRPCLVPTWVTGPLCRQTRQRCWRSSTASSKRGCVPKLIPLVFFLGENAPRGECLALQCFGFSHKVLKGIGAPPPQSPPHSRDCGCVDPGRPASVPLGLARRSSTPSCLKNKSRRSFFPPHFSVRAWLAFLVRRLGLGGVQLQLRKDLVPRFVGRRGLVDDGIGTASVLYPDICRSRCWLLSTCPLRQGHAPPCAPASTRQFSFFVFGILFYWCWFLVYWFSLPESSVTARVLTSLPFPSPYPRCGAGQLEVYREEIAVGERAVGGLKRKQAAYEERINVVATEWNTLQVDKPSPLDPEP